MYPSRMSRRNALAVGGGLAGSLALAGCGAGSPSSGGSTAPPVGSQVENDLKSRGKQLGTPVISVLAYAAPQAQAIQELSNQFTSLSGIQVKWTILDEQSAANKATVALGSSSGGYDVVHTTSQLLPTYAQRSWLKPLADLLTEHTVPSWTADAYGSTNVDLMSFGGKLMGAPMFIGTQVFYYRTDVFAEHNISTPPKSYDELADVCKKVTSDKIKGIALRSAPSPAQLMFVWTAWLYAAGGAYYRQRSGTNYSEPALDSPEAVKALTTYCDLLQHAAPTGSTNWSVEDAVRAFASGQVAMVQEGAVFGGTFNDKTQSQVAGKVGTFVLPSGPAGTFVPFNNHGWGVAANSKNAQAASLFVQWATLKQTLVAATGAKTAFSTPPLASAYESEAYKKRFGFDHYVPTVIKTIGIANHGGVSPIKNDPNYVPGTPAWNTIGQQVCEQLSRAVTGQITPQKAIKNAAAVMRKN